MSNDNQKRSQSDYPVHTEERDAELRLLKVLYRQWYWIAAFALLIGVLTALYTLRLQDVYQSEAALIINAPDTPLSGEVEPLDAEALKILSDSTSMHRTLFTSLTEQNILDSGAGFVSFRQKLSSRVLNISNEDRLPLLQLRVKHVDPEKAALAANAWAELILKQTQNMYQAEVRDYEAFTNRVLSQMESELADAEQRLSNVRVEAKLDLMKREMQNSISTYGDLFNTIQELRQDVRNEETELAEMRKKISQQQHQGKWYGDWLFQEVVKEKILTGEEFAPPNRSELAQRIHDAALSVINSEARLAEFQEKSRIETKRIEFTHMQKELAWARSKLAERENELQGLEKEYAAKMDGLAGMPEKVILKKAITDDTYWQQYLENNETLNATELPVMASEFGNNRYYALISQIDSLAGEIANLRATTTHLHRRTEELRSQIGAIQRQLLEAENQQSSIQSELKNAQYYLTFLQNAYESMREQAERLVTKLEKNRALLVSEEKALEELSRQQRLREEKVRAAEDQIAGLEREINSLLETRQSLAGRAREASLLMITVKDATRSGVTLLYEAAIDRQKVAPTRSRTVLGAMLGAAALAALFLIIRSLMRENYEAAA
ncbi:MAG: Wzz/FepE/Etk N-terminal domain-containing protein [Candidatus Sumerlaeota bacterium]